MTLQAYTFTLTTREADTLGLAVLCPEARYASVQLAGVKRLLRRHASPAQWKEIERLIAERLQTKPMATGVFHEVLAGGDEDKRVAYLHVMPVEAEPLAAAEALDAFLQRQPVEMRLRLLRED